MSCIVFNLLGIPGFRLLSLSDFGQLCKEDLEVDRQLDALLKEEMIRTDEEAPSVIESRLSGWWAYKLGLSAPRIWLEVDDIERAKRVQAREGGDLNSIIEANQQRSKVDEQRFDELYGLLPQQTEPYTHIINASDLNPQEVLASVLDILEE